MSEQVLPDWSEVVFAAERLALASSPAELHGGLCGWLAAGGANVADWPARVMVDPALPAPTAGDALDRLRTVSSQQLADPEFGFQLLLPEDELVSVRATELFAWCRAFLGGFGLALGNTTLSEDAQEALADLANLGGAQLDDGAQEDDEEALAEIEEYLRMAVLLLHADCVLGGEHRQRLH